MLELFQSYSLQDIIIFIIIFALAIKGLITFMDWVQQRTTQAVHKAEIPGKLKHDIAEHDQAIEDIKNSLGALDKMLNTLVESDRDDIKAYITRQHHYFCYQRKWIDDYSLDCIERRYVHYKREGGNSFIEQLMEELRGLPKQPRDPEEIDITSN